MLKFVTLKCCRNTLRKPYYIVILLKKKKKKTSLAKENINIGYNFFKVLFLLSLQGKTFVSEHEL